MHKPLQHFHDELNQLFAKACEDHRDGLLDAAGQSYLKLLDYFAEAPILHYNLGLVYYGQGEYGKARESFATASEFQTDDVDILFNLALSKKQTGDPVGAIDTYKQVLRLSPDDIDTLYNLAVCYQDTARHDLAMATYHAVLQRMPAHQSANNNLAFLYHLQGDMVQAVWYYRMVLRQNPEHQRARHMVAALTGAEATSAPDLYVKEVFDNYSGYFEKSLVTELKYRVPQSLRAIFDEAFAGRRPFVHALDLGCGTGLGGQAFADTAEILDGIDLSEKMVALAGEKGIYRKLQVGSIAGYLREIEDTFDLYLATDVFAYVGDLHETFRLLGQRAGTDVLCCFSTEAVEGSGYRLRTTGRFAHSCGYIEEQARATGWQVVVRQETVLRKDKGVGVQGHLWILRLVG